MDYWSYIDCMVKILDTDTANEIAKKIYEKFEVLESCTVTGWFVEPGEQLVLGKGEMVLNELRRLDSEEHIDSLKSGKNSRRNSLKPNSIGGPIAHKIFTWERRIVNNEPRYTIWRWQ